MTARAPRTHDATHRAGLAALRRFHGIDEPNPRAADRKCRAARKPLVVKLVAVIRAAGLALPGTPETDAAMWRVARTYAGSVQRSQGAWRWFLEVTDAGRANPMYRTYAGDVGGYYPATQYVRRGAGCSIGLNDVGQWTLWLATETTVPAKGAGATPR